MALPNNPTQLEVIKEVKRLEAEKYDASNPNGYTNNNGTVTSVGAGAGLSISGTASVNPTVNVDSGHKLLSNDEYALLATKRFVLDELDDLPEPMVFKGTLGTGGTITDLPSASAQNNGYTYKVITAGTYASQAAKVGDVFVSNGSAWVLIPAGDDVEDTWRAINVNGTQLKGNGITSGAINFKNGGNVTVTGSGSDITLGVASGYSIPSTTKQSEWDAKADASAVVTSVNGKTGAVTGLATSNPNLLINSNFAINQRGGYFAPVGATVYADDLTTVLGTVRTAIQTNLYNATWRVATSIAATLNGSNITISTGYIKTSDCTSGYVKVGYTVDRWTLDNNSILLPTSDGITLTSACRQFIENKEQLWGKTLTLSFKTASGITSKSGTLPSTAPSSNTTFIFAPTDSSGVSAIVRYVNGNLAVVISSNLGATINWVKLEVGDVATEYTPPLIAEELPKCQRYYTRYDLATKSYGYPIISSGYATSSSAMAFPISLPCSMRKNPTVSYNELYYRYGTSGTNILVSAINTPDYAYGGAIVNLTVTGASGLTVGQSAVLQIRSGGYIAFDAEFY